MYLYRAIDSNGNTVEFCFSERRDLTAAKRFLRKALQRHGRPERTVIDGSQTNREAILACNAENRLQDGSRRKLKPIRIRQSAYFNNRIEQTIAPSNAGFDRCSGLSRSSPLERSWAASR
jgi:transposase-like protein